MPSTTDPSAWEPSVESPPCETLAPAGLTIDLEQVVGQLNVNLFWSSYSNFSPPGNVPEMRGKPLHIARWVRRIEKGSEAIAPLLRKKRQRHLGRIWKTRYAPPRTRFRTCLRAKMGEARAHKHHMTTQMLLKELTATFRDEEKKRRPINKQFAEMTDKRWSKKLDPEEVSNLLAKYDPPENCVEISALALTQKSGYSLTRSKGKPTFGLQIYSKPSRSQVLPL